MVRSCEWPLLTFGFRSHPRWSGPFCRASTASGSPAVSSSRTDTADGADAAGATGATTLVDVTMPQMGVSVAEGTVVAWRFEIGDRIQADETICEISTDKIDTEVPSPVGGILAEILVPVETTVEVGTPLARIAVG